MFVSSPLVNFPRKRGMSSLSFLSLPPSRIFLRLLYIASYSNLLTCERFPRGWKTRADMLEELKGTVGGPEYRFCYDDDDDPRKSIEISFLRSVSLPRRHGCGCGYGYSCEEQLELERSWSCFRATLMPRKHAILRIIPVTRETNNSSANRSRCIKFARQMCYKIVILTRQE